MMRARSRSRSRGRFLLCALGAALAVGVGAGCGNPAVDSRITALGEENPAVAPSEFHRPGQPCVLCHSDYEAASPEITVGGTIFASPAKSDTELPTAVEGAIITMIDAEGETQTATTNCAGNFYLTKEQWNPSFPLRVEVSYPDPGTAMPKPAPPMSSRVSRDGSCAGCHSGTQNQGSPGFVFCEEFPAVAFPVPKCVGTL